MKQAGSRTSAVALAMTSAFCTDFEHPSSVKKKENELIAGMYSPALSPFRVSHTLQLKSS